MVFLKEFFEKVDLEINQQTTKKHANLPRMQRAKLLCDVIIISSGEAGDVNPRVV